MGFFDHLQKKGAISIKAQPVQVRKVETRAPKPAPIRSSPVKSDVPKPQARRSRPAHASDRSRTVSSGGASDTSRRTSENGLKPRSHARKRPSPVQRLDSSDDDSGSDGSLEFRKRVKTTASAEPDPRRRIRSVDAFVEDNGKRLPMVHASKITSKEKPSGFKPAFEGDAEPDVAYLRYPSASQKERYQLVVPRDNDGFKPLDDIVQVIDNVSRNYIPEDKQPFFTDENAGIIRLLRRAILHRDKDQFRKAIEDYNKEIERLRLDGTIAKHLDGLHSLPLRLVERILVQVYSRIVSPRVESLRQYENGTDNVYGELLPRLISDMFKQTRLKSDMVFVDLGSGVGNVVLQAALEIGCQSWGCEMMQNAADLAELQQREFDARCRLWGIAPGKANLIKGDFLKEEKIPQILRKADVVLINNQAFTPQLNNELINHFLDLKEGCQIISLKSFVPAGHKIQSRNLNSPINLLSVKEKNYWSGSVSWTDVGGSYFIATKDSSRLKAFSDGML